ncbi:MAG: hypothetical protein M0C28_22825 [Candidatus Moduliflexus flocculans]|nr:hypothetical protein [Candidatus Moduliflexus flocculans]
MSGAFAFVAHFLGLRFHVGGRPDPRPAWGRRHREGVPGGRRGAGGIRGLPGALCPPRTPGTRC